MLSPLDSFTRATLRTAEFGFFGLVVYTLEQTPFICGQELRRGACSRPGFGLRAPLSAAGQLLLFGSSGYVCYRPCWIVTCETGEAEKAREC